MNKLEYQSILEFSVGSKKYTLEYSENIVSNKNFFWIKLNDEEAHYAYVSPIFEKDNFKHYILYHKKFSSWVNNMCKKEDAISFKEDGLKLTMIVKEHDEDGFLGEVCFDLVKNEEKSGEFLDKIFKREIDKIKECNSSNLESAVKDNITKTLEYLFSQLKILKDDLKTNNNNSNVCENLEKCKEDIRILTINSKEENLILSAKVENLKNSVNFLGSKIISLIDKQDLFVKETKSNINKKVQELKEVNPKLNSIKELVGKTPLEVSGVKFLSEFEYIDFVKNKILPQTTFSKLVLLFDTNIHGDLSSTFHEKCYNKGPTVTFVWDDQGNIFGGFTNLSWSSSGEWKEEKKSFLFSFNKQKIIHIDNRFDCAICDISDRGPSFGAGHDLGISSGCTKNNTSYQSLKHSYGNIDSTIINYEFTGQKYFKVKEYKVFSVLTN